MSRYRLHLILLLAIVLFTLQQGNATAVKLRVLSFNICSTVNGDTLIPWNVRSTKMCIVLHRMEADVMGLQGVSPQQMTDLTQGLPEYSLVSTEATQESKQLDCDPIFYRKATVQLINKGSFWLSETPEVFSSGWDSPHPHAISWAAFQDIKTGRSFIFANVRFDESNLRERLGSAMLIKTFLGKLSNDAPVILTGDFNVADNDIAYSTLLTRIFPMTDAWASSPNMGGETATYNGLGKIPKEEKKRVDYIFLSKTIEIKKAFIDNTLQSDGSYLSDHNIVRAELSWK